MERLILIAGTPETLLWATIGWLPTAIGLALGAVPLGLAIRNALRGRKRTVTVRAVLPGGKTLRPRAA